MSCVLQWLLWFRKDLSTAQHVLCFTVTVVIQERPVDSPVCPVFYSDCCDTGKTCLQPSMSCVLQWLLWYRKDLSIAQYVLVLQWLLWYRKDLSIAQREWKKKKAQKKAQRLKQMEDEREQDKNKWIQFNSKVCYSLLHISRYSYSLTTYTMSLKTTGPLRLIWHNFTNWQHLLIISGTERLFNSQFVKLTCF